MTQIRKLPPVWLMGLANLPYGIYGAIMLIGAPQLLAARGIPEPQIATVTAIALVPGFCGFLVSPVLDVWFSRRTYAVIFAALSAIILATAIQVADHPIALSALLASGYLCQVLYAGSVGGWLSGLVGGSEEGSLSSWIVVANIGGLGLTSIVAVPLIRWAGAGPAGILLGLLLLSPLTIFTFLPAPGPDRRLARESFGNFSRDVFALVRRPSVIRTLVLFSAPAASFALTNTLGGLGRDFRAPEQLVSLTGGLGVALAGMAGSLFAPRVIARVSPLWLYLGIGSVGACFTLALITLPHTPATFVLEMVGENIFQAAAFATQYAIIFQTVGKDNPLAATQFTLLSAATSLPIAYMQVVDGNAYGLHGLDGSYLADGLLGLFACAALAAYLLREQVRPD